jgi:hypothetical protein
MGTGAKWYCVGCGRELEPYQLDPETGLCWHCESTRESNTVNDQAYEYEYITKGIEWMNKGTNDGRVL